MGDAELVPRGRRSRSRVVGVGVRGEAACGSQKTMKSEWLRSTTADHDSSTTRASSAAYTTMRRRAVRGGIDTEEWA